MRTSKSDTYEKMAADYQCLEIARLNEVLKRHGVKSTVKRREICEEYCFDSGAFLDSGWLKSAGKRVHPTLCFAERPLDRQEGLGEISKLYLPSESFAFQDYAMGNMDWYFDEQKQRMSKIKNEMSEDIYIAEQGCSSERAGCAAVSCWTRLAARH